MYNQKNIVVVKVLFLMVFSVLIYGQLSNSHERTKLNEGTKLHENKAQRQGHFRKKTLLLEQITLHGLNFLKQFFINFISFYIFLSIFFTITVTPYPQSVTYFYFLPLTLDQYFFFINFSQLFFILLSLLPLTLTLGQKLLFC